MTLSTRYRAVKAWVSMALVAAFFLEALRSRRHCGRAAGADAGCVGNERRSGRRDRAFRSCHDSRSGRPADDAASVYEAAGSSGAGVGG